MTITPFAFVPSNGIRDASYAPTDPANEAALRQAIQGIPDQLKDYINNVLLPTLASTTASSSGSREIGSETISPLSGNTVYAQLVSLVAYINSISIGAVPNDSITNAKLAPEVKYDVTKNTRVLKNLIINGNFQINQRQKTGTVVLTAGQYGHDRWKAGSSGCTYTFATVENVTTITITAGSLVQVVEGLNISSGTHVLSWTGTSQGKINAGSYGTTGITGTLTGGTNATIEFNTGTISKIVLNKGSIAQEWQNETFDEVLAQCQRYYEKSDFINGILGARTTVAVNTSVGTGFYFIKPKRITPTVYLYSRSETISKISSVNTGLDVGTTVTALNLSTVGTSLITDSGSGLTASAVYDFHYTADAEL